MEHSARSTHRINQIISSVHESARPHVGCADMPYIPVPESCFLKFLERYTHSGAPRWLSADRQHIYLWDGLHGEVEVYSRRGFHLGVVDCDGRYIGDPIKGRRVYV